MHLRPETKSNNSTDTRLLFLSTWKRFDAKVCGVIEKLCLEFKFKFCAENLSNRSMFTFVLKRNRLAFQRWAALKISLIGSREILFFFVIGQ